MPSSKNMLLKFIRKCTQKWVRQQDNGGNTEWGVWRNFAVESSDSKMTILFVSSSACDGHELEINMKRICHRLIQFENKGKS